MLLVAQRSRSSAIEVILFELSAWVLQPDWSEAALQGLSHCHMSDR